MKVFLRMRKVVNEDSSKFCLQIADMKTLVAEKMTQKVVVSWCTGTQRE